MIIDTHVHIYKNIHGKTAEGEIRGTSHGCAEAGGREIQVFPPLCVKTAHTADMLIKHMDIAGIDKAVVLQGSFYGDNNRHAAESVRKYPQRLAAAAFLDPWLPDARRRFESICGHPEFRAVKLECSEPTGFFGIHPDADLADRDIDWLWNKIERRQLVLILDLGSIGSRSYRTEEVREIAARHPGLRIVIAHLAQPSPDLQYDTQKMSLWEKQIELGRLDHVYFDMASLPAYFKTEGYPFDSAGLYIRIALERIGPRKILWGTDVPGMLLNATYGQLLSSAHRHLSFLDPSEQDMVLGLNAMNLFFKKL